MTSFFMNRWVVLVLRLISGGIFIYAGSIKIQHPEDFADSIATFGLLPEATINVFASSLPIFEIIVGVLIIVGRQRRAAAFAIMFITAVFAFALAQALARGLTIDCGCFGSGQPSALKSWASLGRDLLLLGAALVVYCQAFESDRATGV